MDYQIREIKESEYPILSDFLYEAIFIPKGMEKPPKSVIAQPELQVYIADFGKADDWCFVAETKEKIVGAVWVRIMNDYGHVDDETPSFAISLYEEYRRLGIGTALMRAMLQFLKEKGYSQASLSVQKANYAVDMYKKVGFEVVDEKEEEFIMVCRLKQRHENIKDLFKNWNETMIWSCLQGVMGEIHTNAAQDAAMAILGDFVFFAGNPSEALVRFKPESCKQDFMIMVPQNDAWAGLIEKCYGDKAKRITRYAIKKEKALFDVCKLQQAVLTLPEGYELKMLEEREYALCQSSTWARDLVSQFKDYDTYKRLGLGVVVFKDEELVAGASSYSRYMEGIEIEIDTRQDYRRKGLAYACGAKLILRCLEKGLYPSWDAHNKESVALAKKLGYHFSHEYTAYEVKEY